MSKSPQLEDGFTRIANELLEELLGFGLSGRQLHVALTVIRKTYGYGKKQDDMSASQIGQICALSRPHVTEVLGQLHAMKVIHKSTGTFGMIVGINKNHKEWVELDKDNLPKKRAARAEPDKSNHYTYKITHCITGEFYIGVRSCACHPNQDRYIGSDDWIATVKAADLRKEIIQTHQSRSDAEAHEIAIIRGSSNEQLMRNSKLYTCTESVQGVPILYRCTESVQGVQKIGIASTESVQVDSTDSVHTKENLTKENQKKESRSEIFFDDWIDQTKKSGTKPIPEDHAVFKYADKVELPIDFVRLCWLEFKNTFSGNRKKRYADWAKAFSNYVRKNYFRLWFEKDGSWQLTTAGIQLKKEMADR